MVVGNWNLGTSGLSQIYHLGKLMEPLSFTYLPKVQFTVKIRAATCLPESQKLVLRVLGVGEEVQVELSTACECHCEDTQPDAHHCSGGHGNLTCGICRYLYDLSQL